MTYMFGLQAYVERWAKQCGHFIYPGGVLWRGSREHANQLKRLFDLLAHHTRPMRILISEMVG